MKDQHINKAIARRLGWLDLHGPPFGYLRGINPKTGRCEKVPDYFAQIGLFDEMADAMRDAIPWMMDPLEMYQSQSFRDQQIVAKRLIQAADKARKTIE